MTWSLVALSVSIWPATSAFFLRTWSRWVAGSVLDAAEAPLAGRAGPITAANNAAMATRATIRCGDGRVRVRSMLSGIPR